MTGPRGFPSWQHLYEEEPPEKLPWYWPALDPDLDSALSRRGVTAGRILDQGTGPGTQAIALAERGFRVTATDVSAAALAYAARKASERGAQVDFIQDDILASRLTGPFDAVFDRGCFHVLSPDQRDAYAATMHKVLSPSGWLFVKTFSHEEPGDRGPHRFTRAELERVFATRFATVEILDTVYQGTLDPFPKALMATFRRKP